ncbi:MAG: tetratricopeptide repeat protein, partial [Deltaproteobacteria bacterium]|nr:tetratricopeptide repeat protein [Deltaproteobacteria bacterium]
MITILFFGLLFTGPWKATCEAAKGPALHLKEADACLKALRFAEKKKKYRHNWFRCIDRYKKIYTRYPKSDQAAWAIYHSARLYTSLYSYSKSGKDLDEAIQLYGRLTGRYRAHRLADDAQYGIGEIYYVYKKDLPRAYEAFLEVETAFPSGDMRPRAKKMLDKLAVIMKKSGASARTGVGPGPRLNQADKCRKELQSSAKKKRYRYNWVRCIEQYKEIYTRHAKSDQAAWALYHAARLFTSLYAHDKKETDLDEAIKLYRKLVGNYRDHRLADDAQYGIGEIYYKYK